MKDQKKKILTLHLAGEHFDEVRAGRKWWEYRLASKWRNRIVGKTFDEVHLLRGYPKTGDESKIIRCKWNGCRLVQMGFEKGRFVEGTSAKKPQSVLSISLYKRMPLRFPNPPRAKIKPETVWVAFDPWGKARQVWLHPPAKNALAWLYVADQPDRTDGYIQTPGDMKAAKAAGYRVKRFNLQCPFTEPESR